LLNNFLVV